MCFQVAPPRCLGTGIGYASYLVTRPLARRAATARAALVRAHRGLRHREQQPGAKSGRGRGQARARHSRPAPARARHWTSVQITFTFPAAPRAAVWRTATTVGSDPSRRLASQAPGRARALPRTHATRGPTQRGGLRQAGGPPQDVVSGLDPHTASAAALLAGQAARNRRARARRGRARALPSTA